MLGIEGGLAPSKVQSLLPKAALLSALDRVLVMKPEPTNVLCFPFLVMRVGPQEKQRSLLHREFLTLN